MTVQNSSLCDFYPVYTCQIIVGGLQGRKPCLARLVEARPRRARQPRLSRVIIGKLLTGTESTNENNNNTSPEDGFICSRASVNCILHQPSLALVSHVKSKDCRLLSPR